MSSLSILREPLSTSSTGKWVPPVNKKRKPVLAAEGMHFLSLFDRFLLVFACHHKWSWPQTLLDIQYPVKTAAIETSSVTVPEVRYDAHQTCPLCGTHRLFHTKVWFFGPKFRRVVVPKPALVKAA